MVKGILNLTFVLFYLYLSSPSAITKHPFPDALRMQVIQRVTDKLLQYLRWLSTTRKKAYDIPVPSRDVTYQTLTGRE